MPPSSVLYNSGVFVDANLEEVSANEEHESDFETAIHYAGTGKFQNILLGVSGAIYATCAISTTTLSFVLPSAGCEYNLSSADKGKLSAMPLVGMLFGCVMWGALANAKGRRTAIIVSLLMDAVAAIVSAFALSYELFLVCRFFNGFGIIGATSLIFSFVGEFLSIKHRDKYLGKLEIFWNIGIIILPGVAWALLNKTTVEVFDGGNFSPWRIFILICSLPSITSAIMIYFLPETPKFLIANDEYTKAKQVFRKIYTVNTGKSEELYPVQTLRGEENDYSSTTIKMMPIRRRGYRESISECVEIIKEITHQQYYKYLIITCLADFGLMTSYYTLVMWFPEIFDRFSDYKQQHPNSPVSVCIVSRLNVTSSLNIYDDFENPDIQCDPAMADKVFIDTVIIGLSCIPTSVTLSYFMYKVGKRSVLVCSFMVSGLSTLALNWVTTTSQTLILSCVFEAMTSILESVLFCVVVDLFPTDLRALALTITATSGRLGAIFGNIIFGALLDLNCIIPIYLFGFLLIASGVLCLAVPRNENYITLH